MAGRCALSCRAAAPQLVRLALQTLRFSRVHDTLWCFDPVPFAVGVLPLQLLTQTLGPCGRSLRPQLPCCRPTDGQPCTQDVVPQLPCCRPSEVPSGARSILGAGPCARRCHRVAPLLAQSLGPFGRSLRVPPDALQLDAVPQLPCCRPSLLCWVPCPAAATPRNPLVTATLRNTGSLRALRPLRAAPFPP